MSEEGHQHGQEVVLRDIEAVLLPSLLCKLLISLVAVVHCNPQGSREFKLGKVERLKRAREGKISAQSSEVSSLRSSPG